MTETFSAELLPGQDPIELLWNGQRELVTRLDQNEEAVGAAMEALARSLTATQDLVAKLVVQEAENRVEPQSWAARAGAQEWNELADWIDWVNTTYSTDQKIYPCWPAHGGVVEELAGMYQAWRAALIADRKAKRRGSAELTAWHDRWFWPTMARLKSGHYVYSNCKSGHAPERTSAVGRTDRSLYALHATPNPDPSPNGALS